MPVAVMPETTMYLQQTVVPEIAMPVTTTPVIPFITELPNCPDICFSDILASPLGCLDPILTIYGTKDVCPLPNLPVSPLLPAASPVSALAPPFSRLLPPVSDCDCYNQYLKRVPIPPPFI
ncbi:jg18793 [Pararge aegeria aegeria]|uniref:Jg18793 protein n=2 Tax=Pararge aegeria TaxID=116150 RepID=A0A8S4S9E0_9NEOP|nr:jg18793 [Pararge aegeria aegeria]